MADIGLSSTFLITASSAAACVLLATTVASTTTEPERTLVMKTWDGLMLHLAASHDCMSEMKACCSPFAGQR